LEPPTNEEIGERNFQSERGSGATRRINGEMLQGVMAIKNHRGGKSKESGHRLRKQMQPNDGKKRGWNAPVLTQADTV